MYTKRDDYSSGTIVTFLSGTIVTLVTILYSNDIAMH